MKKSFLNLRKMGFILVAASAMVAFSCGGEETTTEEDVTEAVDNLMDELNETVEEISEDVEETVSDMEEGADSLSEEMSCEGGEGHSCEEGSCGEGE